MSSDSLPDSEKTAPVQGYKAGIPWSLHLEAYDVYCKRWGPQKAMIEGHCRGGFSVGELDMFIPGWRDRVSEIGRLKAEVASLRASLAAAEARADSAVPSSHPSALSDRGSGEGVQPPDGTTERDAARWRWMRDHAADSDHIVFSFNNGRESFGLAGLVADTFVDAAMSEAVCAEPAATTASAPANSGTDELIAAAEKHCESYHDDPRWSDHNFRADLLNAFFQGAHWQSKSIAVLREALARLLERYVGLVNCGDCGNWDPEIEPVVIAARSAMARSK
jgi:hypothetical protein